MCVAAHAHVFMTRGQIGEGAAVKVELLLCTCGEAFSNYT